MVSELTGISIISYATYIMFEVFPLKEEKFVYYIHRFFNKTKIFVL